MAVTIHVDISDADHELRRLEDGPDLQDLVRLDAAITRLYAETQAVVHIITGSLKASGKLEDSKFEGHVWHGQFSYGGVSEGSAHDPVTYAKVERAKAGSKGSLGPHDFMWPTHGTAHEYGEAIMAFLRGE